MAKVEEKPVQKKVTVEESTQRANHLFVSGIVQGVFYRDAMQKQAVSCGVNGWCRNLDNGQVEALIVGDETQMAAMISWAYRGSDAAVVSLVEVFPLEQSPDKDVIEAELSSITTFEIKD